jgi:hypothetical protein
MTSPRAFRISSAVAPIIFCRARTGRSQLPMLGTPGSRAPPPADESASSRSVFLSALHPLEGLVAPSSSLLDYETMGTSQLRNHNFVQVDQDLVLRPMTEGDWDAVLEWADDPEVLWFSEADNVEHRTREEHQRIYRAVSHTPADVFIFEVNGTPMGDGWLQRMSLARVLDANPGKDCRRVDLQLPRSGKAVPQAKVFRRGTGGGR